MKAMQRISTTPIRNAPILRAMDQVGMLRELSLRSTHLPFLAANVLRRHVNAMDKFPDGDFLVSSRRAFTLCKSQAHVCNLLAVGG